MSDDRNIHAILSPRVEEPSALADVTTLGDGCNKNSAFFAEWEKNWVEVRGLGELAGA
jgi:hypothetical protein